MNRRSTLSHVGFLDYELPLQSETGCDPSKSRNGIVTLLPPCPGAVAGGFMATLNSRNEGGRHKLVGTWKLLSASLSTAGGERNDAPFGPSPTGFLTYTREGRMSAMISYGGRKPLSVSDWSLAAVDEKAEGFRHICGLRRAVHTHGRPSNPSRRNLVPTELGKHRSSSSHQVPSRPNHISYTTDID